MEKKASESGESSATPPDLGRDFDPVDLIVRALEYSCAAETTDEWTPAEMEDHAFPVNGKETGDT